MKLFGKRATSGSRRSARLWGLRLRKFGIVIGLSGTVMALCVYAWVNGSFGKISGWTE